MMLPILKCVCGDKSTKLRKYDAWKCESSERWKQTKMKNIIYGIKKRQIRNKRSGTMGTSGWRAVWARYVIQSKRAHLFLPKRTFNWSRQWMHAPTCYLCVRVCVLTKREYFAFADKFSTLQYFMTQKACTRYDVSERMNANEWIERLSLVRVNSSAGGRAGRQWM